MPVILGFKLLSLFGLSEKAAKRFAPLALIGMALLAIVLAVLAFNWWLDGREKAAVEADRLESRAEALDTARGADEAAQAATEGKRNEVERTNAEAEAAARDSDDPLRAGLERLRNNRTDGDR